MTIDQAVAQCLAVLGLPNFEMTGGPTALYLATDALEERIGSDPIVDLIRAAAEDCIDFTRFVEDSKKFGTTFPLRVEKRGKTRDRFGNESGWEDMVTWGEYFDKETAPASESDGSFIFAINSGPRTARIWEIPSRLTSGFTRVGANPVPMFCDAGDINTDKWTRNTAVAFVSLGDRPSGRLSGPGDLVSPPREMEQTVTKLAWLYACHPGYECEHRIREAVGEGAIFVEIKDKEGSGYVWKLHAKIRGLLTKTSNPNVRWWKRSTF